jgi:branched-chain amino acid transport system permease protein
MDATGIVQIVFSGLTIGSIYALMALGFHIVFITIKNLNFAYGSFVALGGLIGYTLLTKLHLHFSLALLIIVSAGALGGFLFERFVVRPVFERSFLTLIICTLAIGEAIENSSSLFWGAEALPVPPFVNKIPVDLFGVKISPQNVWIIGLTLLSIIIIKIYFNFTLAGKAMRAASNNRMAAKLCGISPLKVSCFAFILSLALGCLAGMIISPLTFAGGFVGIHYTVKGFTGAILGGIASTTGSIIGGVILGVIEALFRGFITTRFSEGFIMIILLLILLLRPDGLFKVEDEE